MWKSENSIRLKSQTGFKLRKTYMAVRMRMRMMMMMMIRTSIGLGKVLKGI
jgi:hypothetical protein